ncbi:hypothetical protein A0128_17000 [Leptospira tipperaryensis]|uniref:Uncharacterized protein n=1 Tax=Leptospira tipperaryensis TaxID=2564040 RepID=A0A1D7V0P3_9LEPT|nr:hypothetical protein A0128_17000 [Leptospira tipperaryensis]
MQVNSPPRNLVGTTTKTPFGIVSHSKSIPKIRLRLQLSGREAPQKFQKKIQKGSDSLEFLSGENPILRN